MADNPPHETMSRDTLDIINRYRREAPDLDAGDLLKDQQVYKLSELPAETKKQLAEAWKRLNQRDFGRASAAVLEEAALTDNAYGDKAITFYKNLYLWRRTLARACELVPPRPSDVSEANIPTNFEQSVSRYAEVLCRPKLYALCTSHPVRTYDEFEFNIEHWGVAGDIEQRFAAHSIYPHYEKSLFIEHIQHPLARSGELTVTVWFGVRRYQEWTDAAGAPVHAAVLSVLQQKRLSLIEPLQDDYNAAVHVSHVYAKRNRLDRIPIRALWTEINKAAEGSAEARGALVAKEYCFRVENHAEDRTRNRREPSRLFFLLNLEKTLQSNPPIGLWMDMFDANSDLFPDAGVGDTAISNVENGPLFALPAKRIAAACGLRPFSKRLIPLPENLPYYMHDNGRFSFYVQPSSAAMLQFAALIRTIEARMMEHPFLRARVTLSVCTPTCNIVRPTTTSVIWLVRMILDLLFSRNPPLSSVSDWSYVCDIFAKLLATDSFTPRTSRDKVLLSSPVICSAIGCHYAAKYKCGRCESVSYCSDDCSRYDWHCEDGGSGHRAKCSVLSK